MEEPLLQELLKISLREYQPIPKELNRWVKKQPIKFPDDYRKVISTGHC